MTKIAVLAGTRKGGLIFTSDSERKKWQAGDLHFKAWNVMHMTWDARDGRLHAAAGHDVFGPSTHYSDDWGETWTQAEKPPAFERPSKSGRPPSTVADAMNPDSYKGKPEKVLKVWHIQPGRETEAGTLLRWLASFAPLHCDRRSPDGQGGAWGLRPHVAFSFK